MDTVQEDSFQDCRPGAKVFSYQRPSRDRFFVQKPEGNWWVESQLSRFRRRRLFSTAICGGDKVTVMFYLSLFFIFFFIVVHFFLVFSICGTCALLLQHGRLDYYWFWFVLCWWFLMSLSSFFSLFHLQKVFWWYFGFVFSVNVLWRILLWLLTACLSSTDTAQWIVT